MHPIHRSIGLVAFAAACLMAAPPTFAQGTPGGGMGGMGGMRGGEHGRGGQAPERRADGERAPEAAVRPHPLQLLALELERRAGELQLGPEGAQALADFARDARDFAGLEDRIARERRGLAKGAVHAVVDLQRDLAAHAENAKELASAATDLGERWKRLDRALNDVQRRQVNVIYAGVLMPGVVAQKP